MPLVDLLTDKRIITGDLAGEERTVAQDFVGRRVRALIDADATLADPKKPGDITTAATPIVAARLIADLPRVRTAFTTIWTRVTADVAKKQHVPVDKPTLRKRVSNRPPTGDGRTMRRRLVLSIVFQAAASDMTLADPANIERLHRLCDRRLRLVERMMYEVGRQSDRAWSRSQIRTHAGGPWIDGVERAFEYPRVPRAFFEETCQPDANDVCKAPMALWKLGDDRNLVGSIQTNPATTKRWQPNAADNYRLDYTATVANSPKAVEAINDLFAPSTDFLARNLLYCDHTIHALHLEALVFAESKRRAAGDTAWLDGPVAAKGKGWLSIFHPLVSPTALQPDGGKYLVGAGEPAFFEHVTVRANDLQVGDHLIVYNHPAYEFTTFHGAWKLENALVVQTSPGLLLQGHGTNLLTMAEAKAVMLNYFAQALDGCRAALRPLAAVTSPGPKPNTVKVNTTAPLRTGMVVDIVEPTTDTLVAVGRRLTSIDGRARIVTYDGASVTVTAKHVLRRRHVRQFKKYDSLQLETPTSDTEIFLLRRVEPANSTYAPGSLDADWYVAWIGKDRDEAIRKDPTRAAFVKDKHLVDYTVEVDGANTRTVGWFPLYQPALRRKQPVLKGGKIAAIQPVTIGPDNIAAWTWFADPAAATALVPVIRPKVV